VRPRYGRIVAALVAGGTTATAVLGAAGALPGLPDEAAVASTGVPGAAPAAGAGEAAVRLAGQVGTPILPEAADSLPSGSGTGRRVVFAMSAQRVWLVGASERVQRTYLVSGSLTDNLRPGTYEVYSTSRHAVGVDDSGTMEFMVRFARGAQAAIGFHDIPVSDGTPVQARGQLGTPQSHGCIRQWRPDAKALWRFATVGTKVVVVP
jgi:hypothetical protein